jgi:non-ribosomal peptide synthetase component F
MEDSVVCNIPAFLEREASLTTVGRIVFDLPQPYPATVIETAWCVTLYMYTNLNHVCFYTVDIDGKITTRASTIQEDDDLETIATNVQQPIEQAAEPAYQSNTATIFMRDGHPNGESDINDTESLSNALWEGIDVALCASTTKAALVFRRNFMSKPEAQHLIETFSHVLGTYGAKENAPRLIQDIRISPSDAKRIVHWNSLKLVTAETLVHNEFSRVASSNPDATAIESWDGNMTYGELEQATDALAVHLRETGVGLGDWVLVCFTKSRWAIISVSTY